MRSFSAKDYVPAKAAHINHFFTQNGLDSVVVGISGGVDSAVVLMLYIAAARMEGSPIKEIRALMMPINGEGTTGQRQTIDKAVLLRKKIESTYPDFNLLQWRMCYLTGAYEAMKVESGEENLSAWTNGQMASVLRTPMFYYQAAIMQQNGLKSVVSGTTNRDEGCYIGFFGKASDGMVDVQPIADIHKSEVYKVAEFLWVPVEITSDEPKGDVWDGRNDEQMIGAPYWFLQEVIEEKCKHNSVDYEQWCLYGHELYDISFEMHHKWLTNIEQLHKLNAHKYRVGSPAHFLDVMERKCPGGW